MENNGVATPAENGSSTQEVVSSTTQSIEPTKRSIRVQTWRKIQENHCGISYNQIFNRIPSFVDNEKAGCLLADTDEFKKATHIKVNIDFALQAAKLQTLLAGKNLYLPSTRDSKALFLKVDVPEDATDERKKEILHIQDLQQHRTEISLEKKQKLDMIIIGSVVVSRDGYRIGRGNGFTDLDIGLLIEVGAITPETIIATMVHDTQVVESLPINLFQKYDTPVDMIITPTEVIRVSKRLTRPKGLYWELISDRRTKIVPALAELKDMLEKSGKPIALKEEDTDVEHFKNRNRRRGPLRRRFQRRNNRRTTSQTDTEHQGGGESGQTQQRRSGRRNKFSNNRRRRTTKSEGDQSGVESKSQERKEGDGGAQKKRKQRKNRPNRDFCVKLSNITREMRIKDLKSELRKRECNPVQITWKGALGKCYLHFGNRSGQPSTEDDINKVLKSLEALTLTVSDSGNQAGGDATSGGEGDGATTTPTQTKTVNLSVELMKFSEKKAANGGDAAATNAETGAAGDAGVGRVEAVDTTTV